MRAAESGWLLQWLTRPEGRHFLSLSFSFLNVLSSATQSCSVARALYQPSPLTTTHRRGLPARRWAWQALASSAKPSPRWPTEVPRRLLAAPPRLFTPHLGSTVEDARRRIEICAAEGIGLLKTQKRTQDPLN